MKEIQREHPKRTSIRGLVAMTSASHAEGRQFDPGQVYLNIKFVLSEQKGHTRI